MAVIISNALLNSNPGEPLTHARIGYRSFSRASGASVSASSATTNNPAVAATIENTFEFWQPSSLPATLEINAGQTRTATYMGVGVHDMGSNGNTVEAQYYDGSSWQTISSWTPGNDDPVMFLFQPTDAQRWRIRISGGAAPFIGAFFVGEALEMERAIYGGHSPVRWSRTTKRTPSNSESGNYLGLSVVRRGVSTDYGWSNLTYDWYKANFDPFVEYATQGPGMFFLAWRPMSNPIHTVYGWISGNDITPSNNGTRDLMDVSISVRGYVDDPETTNRERYS